MNDRLSIKAWAEADRPREKLMLKGKAVLSDAELIAILIGSGYKDESAVEVARRILNSVDNDLYKLSKLSVNDLMRFKGIGAARAIGIAAALELGRRRKEVEKSSQVSILSSKDAYDVLYPFLSDLDHEQFYVIMLNRANIVIDTLRVSQGGVNGTVADAKVIFKWAVERLASSLILAHNHPSGNLKPSQADIQLTKNIQASGKLLDIAVLDHIIVTDHGYFSFADEGRMT